MIYLFVLLITLYLALKYDILGGRNNGYNKSLYFNLLLIIYIGLSGFQFQVGTDVYNYMIEYESFDIASFNFSDLFEGGEERRQPGWLLLLFLCKSLSSNFFIFKLIHAIVINVAVFLFFKRESKYPFLCIFLYAMMGYLVINFNILRQSFALALVLYGYSYLNKNNYRQFILCAIGAFMFHSSAILILVFPLFKFLKYNKYVVGITLSILILSVYYLIQADLTGVIFEVFNSGLIDENVSSIGIGYMQSEKLGIRDDFAIFSLSRLFVFIVILYNLFKFKDMFGTYMSLAYLLILIITGFFPVLWRFRIYFDFSYILILAIFIKEFDLRVARKYSSYVLIVVVAYLSLKDYLVPYEGSTMRYIDQYYPYHSIFDPVVEYKRIRYFG